MSTKLMSMYPFNESHNIEIHFKYKLYNNYRGKGLYIEAFRYS